jgi:hypothetical protein
MIVIFAMQVLVSLLFFIQKTLVLVGKRAGWLAGVVAAGIGIIYFVVLGLYIMCILEVGLIAIMTYAYVKKETKNARVEMMIFLLTIAVMLLLVMFTFSGALTIIELLTASGLLLGSYALMRGYMVSGWSCGLVGHLFAAIIGYSKDQQLFSDFQIASIIVSAVGVMLAVENLNLVYEALFDTDAVFTEKSLLKDCAREKKTDA